MHRPRHARLKYYRFLSLVFPLISSKLGKETRALSPLLFNIGLEILVIREKNKKDTNSNGSNQNIFICRWYISIRWTLYHFPRKLLDLIHALSKRNRIQYQHYRVSSFSMYR